MDNTSSTLLKIKVEEAQITNIRHKRVNLIKNPIDIKRLRKYYE